MDKSDLETLKTVFKMLDPNFIHIMDIIRKYADDKNYTGLLFFIKAGYIKDVLVHLDCEGLQYFVDLGYSEPIANYIFYHPQYKNKIVIAHKVVPADAILCSIEECEELYKNGWTFTTKILIELVLWSKDLPLCDWVYDHCDFSIDEEVCINSNITSEIREWLYDHFPYLKDVLSTEHATVLHLHK